MISQADFSLPEQTLSSIIKNNRSEQEIKNRVIHFLNVVSTFKIDNIIKEKIKTVRYFITKNSDALSPNFFVDEVGIQLLKYAEEIYSKDPEKLLKAVSKNDDVKEKFFDLFESILETRKGLKDDDLIELYKIITEVVDITGMTLATRQ